MRLRFPNIHHNSPLKQTSRGDSRAANQNSVHTRARRGETLKKPLVTENTSIMSGNKDRSTYYKKRRIDELDDQAPVAETYNAGPSTASDDPPPPPVRVVNLAPNEALHRRRSVEPLKVYLGNSLFLEVKEFRKTLYAGLYKEEDGVAKNRFNFPMTQLPTVEEGFEIIKDHVRNSAE